MCTIYLYLTSWNFVLYHHKLRKCIWIYIIVRCINRSFGSKSWAKLAFWSSKCLPNSDCYFFFLLPFLRKIIYVIYTLHFFTKKKTTTVSFHFPSPKKLKRKQDICLDIFLHRPFLFSTCSQRKRRSNKSLKILWS